MSIALAHVLVVAATGRELAPGGGWLTLCCGVGPVDAAAQTAAALVRHRPLAVVHVGDFTLADADLVAPHCGRHRVDSLRPLGA
jgi:hypothetical protein